MHVHVYLTPLVPSGREDAVPVQLHGHTVRAKLDLRKHVHA